MGQIFQRAYTYRAKDGTKTKKTCETWTLRYYRNGRAIQEPTKLTSKTAAKNLLKLREGDIVKGVPISARGLRLTFDEAVEAVVRDYQMNKRRTVDGVRRRIDLHLIPFFGGRRMAEISTDHIRRYITDRQSATTSTRRAHVVTRKGVSRTVSARKWTITGASNAEIELELNILKRAFTLAMQAGSLVAKPHVPRLQLNNVRSGFFEAEQFEAVRSRLPEALQPVVTFLYVTGWRVDSEVLKLEWRQVDFKAGTVTLDPGTTKNGEGRVFPMLPTLRTLLLEQRQRTDAAQKETDTVIAAVFHRKGKPIRGFRRAWVTACRGAGCPGRFRHDFRRTAVRNLTRAGVPEKIAMQMTGHKTRSVFDRYDIVSEGDLQEAGRKLQDRIGTVTRNSTAELRENLRIS